MSAFVLQKIRKNKPRIRLEIINPNYNFFSNLRSNTD